MNKDIFKVEYPLSVDHATQNQALMERSGTITSTVPLVGFLYALMRDHIQPGIVERLVREENSTEETEFCNGFLALYAKDLAERLLRKKE